MGLYADIDVADTTNTHFIDTSSKIAIDMVKSELDDEHNHI